MGCQSPSSQHCAQSFKNTHVFKTKQDRTQSLQSIYFNVYVWARNVYVLKQARLRLRRNRILALSTRLSKEGPGAREKYRMEKKCSMIISIFLTSTMFLSLVSFFIFSIFLLEKRSHCISPAGLKLVSVDQSGLELTDECLVLSLESTIKSTGHCA